MSPEQVGQLAELLGGEGIRTLRLEMACGPLTIRLAPRSGRFVDGSATAQTEMLTVASRTVGEFLAAHPGRRSPPKKLGEPVAAGDLLGFVRVGPLLTPVVVDATFGRGGILAEMLVGDGALVGFGTPLFQVLPS